MHQTSTTTTTNLNTNRNIFHLQQDAQDVAANIDVMDMPQMNKISNLN